GTKEDNAGGGVVAERASCATTIGAGLARSDDSARVFHAVYPQATLATITATMAHATTDRRPASRRARRRCARSASAAATVRAAKSAGGSWAFHASHRFVMCPPGPRGGGPATARGLGRAS